MNIVITGAAGFIGFNLSTQLKQNGHKIFGIDNLRSSYTHKVIKDRRDVLKAHGIPLLEGDIRGLSSKSIRSELTSNNDIDAFVHLAAWPGVMKSVEDPQSYFNNNLEGFMNILNVIQVLKPTKFLYASSSSVYGDKGSEFPCDENVSLPPALNFYALTKQVNEMMARSVNLGSSQVCALRFFTVFGPWGRPDMAYWKFADSILKDETVYMRGSDGGLRDYTNVNDLTRVLEIMLNSNIQLPSVVNLAKGEHRSTKELLELLERFLGKKARVVFTERYPNEANTTLSNPSLLNELIPNFNWSRFESAVEDFANWFKNYR